MNAPITRVYGLVLVLFALLVYFTSKWAVFDADERYVELRSWLVSEYRKPIAERAEEARAIFAELELDDDAPGSRHLLESDRFRALLAERPAFARAA